MQHERNREVLLSTYLARRASDKKRGRDGTKYIGDRGLAVELGFGFGFGLGLGLGLGLA